MQKRSHGMNGRSRSMSESLAWTTSIRPARSTTSARSISHKGSMQKRSRGMNGRSRSKSESSEWIISIRRTRSTTSASVYNSQGKYAEAISWYERALKIYEREFGVDHINSAETIMGIGLVYNSQGQVCGSDLMV